MVFAGLCSVARLSAAMTAYGQDLMAADTLIHRPQVVAVGDDRVLPIRQARSAASVAYARGSMPEIIQDRRHAA